jgi:hypothetical protein
LERQQLMNQVYAVVPMAALVVVMGFALSLAWRWSQVRIIQRDLRGDAPLIITGGTVYDADRNPGPLVDFSGVKPAIPTLTDPVLQAATTSRDQAIDLVTRGTHGPVQRKGLAKQMAEPSQTLLPTATQIRVLPPEQARPLLGDVIPGIVRDAMQDELTEE